MNKVKMSMVALLVAFGIGSFALPSLVMSTNVGASAASDAIKGGAGAADPDGGTGASLETSVKGVVNVLLYLIGVIAVVMIIIGGIMYVLSSGDPAKAKKAKDTILYAVIGLVVAVLAYAIVNFVLTQLV